MIEGLLPDIPRLFTGIAEWAAVLVYVLATNRRSARWIPIVVGLLPAFIGLQLFLGILPQVLWTLGMFTAALAVLGAIQLSTTYAWRDSIYLAMRAFILAEFMQSLHWQLWVALPWSTDQILTGSTLPSPIVAGALVSLVLIYGAVCAVVYVAERRNFSGTPWTGVERSTLLISVGIALVAFTFSNMSFVINTGPFVGSSGTDVFYIRTLVDLLGLVALYVQQSRRSHSRASSELAVTQLMMQAQHSQYLQSQRNADDLNRIHHDLKHVVHALREEESAERREHYLNELESTVRRYESETRTGHAPLDVILSTQQSRCVERGISMTTMVDGTALKFMDLMSLSTLFGNALDNAIEASCKIPDPEQRIIKVAAFNRQNFVIVTIENYWPHEVEFDDGIPQTTKANSAHHGFGSRSIRRITETYRGTVTFTSENDWFTVRVLLPRQAS